MALELNYTASDGIAANTVLIPAQDIDAHQGSHVVLEASSLGNGALRVEQSMSGSYWTPVVMYRHGNNSSPGTTITAAGLYSGQVAGRYIRVIMATASTAGTTTFVVRAGERDVGTLSATGGTSAPLPTGYNVIGRTYPDIGSTTAGGPGLLAHRLISSAASTNATSVKASGGRLLWVRGFCNASAPRYLKFYNKTSAPTVGTDVPVLTFPVQPSEVFTIDLNPYGYLFSAGIAYALTVNAADNDSTALAAAEVQGLIVLYI